MATAAEKISIAERLSAGAIPMRVSFAFSLAIGIGQLLTNTDPIFALLFFSYTQFFVIAFNSLGGARTVNGLALAALALKTVLISQVAKLGLLEPAHSNLTTPILTMGVMTVGMFTVACVSFHLGSIRTPKQTHFLSIVDPVRLRRISITSLVVGFFGSLVYFGLSVESLGPMGAGMASYLKFALPLSTVSAVGARVMETSRKHCTDFLVLFTVLVQVVLGVVTTSKSLSFEALLCLVLAAYYFGYRPKMIAIIVGAGAAFFLTTVIVPITFLARDLVFTETLPKKVEIVTKMVSELLSSSESLSSVYEQRKEDEINFLTETGGYYENARSMLLERFSLIKAADILISKSALAGTLGMRFFFSTLDILPTSVTGDTPFKKGIFLAHWADVTSDEDENTAVSFTMFGEAYVYGEWLGLVMLSGFLFALFLFANALVLSPLPNNIWSIWLLVLIQGPIAEVGPAWLLFHVTRVLPFCWMLSHAFCWVSKSSSPRHLEQTSI